MFLSLFEVISCCEPYHWYGLSDFQLGIQIDFPHELGGRVVSPITLGKQSFLHTIGVCLSLDGLVTAKDASLEVSRSKDEKEGVDTSDDESGNVD